MVGHYVFRFLRCCVIFFESLTSGEARRKQVTLLGGVVVEESTARAALQTLGRELAPLDLRWTDAVLGAQVRSGHWYEAPRWAVSAAAPVAMHQTVLKTQLNQLQ